MAASNHQLAVHALQVRIHGVHRQAERLCDLGVSQPLRAQGQDLGLALRQPLLGSAGQHTWSAGPQALDKPARDGRAHGGAAGLDGGEQLARVQRQVRLQHVAGGTGFQRPQYPLLVCEDGDHQDVALGVHPPDLADQAQAVAVGQAEVEEDGVQRVPAQLLLGRGEGVRGQHLPLRRRRLCVGHQAFAQQAFVFDDEQRFHRPRTLPPGSQCRRGEVRLRGP